MGKKVDSQVTKDDTIEHRSKQQLQKALKRKKVII